MPKSRVAVAPIEPGNATMGSAYLPDLVAENLNIVAYYGTGQIELSAAVVNIGLGAASGPFTISMWVEIDNDSGTTEFAQNFEVPAGVTLYGRPVFEAALIGGGDLQGPFRNSYLTPPMQVPLEFVDVDPHAEYKAGFMVDSDYAITELRKDNNYYQWTGSLWFLSSAALRERKPIVSKFPAARVRR